MNATLDKLYYSIGEVAERLEVAPSLIRHWEKNFSMIRPKRNKKGNRFYTPEDIRTLEDIKYLVKDKGYTLKGAEEHLKATRKSSTPEKEILDKLENIREKLSAIRDGLKL